MALPITCYKIKRHFSKLSIKNKNKLDKPHQDRIDFLPVISQGLVITNNKMAKGSLKRKKQNTDNINGE